jgi:hypothetical protein
MVTIIFVQYFDALALLTHRCLDFGKRAEHLRGPSIGVPALVGNNVTDAALSDFFHGPR